jgi:Zn-dependent protease with chaperone function
MLEAKSVRSVVKKLISRKLPYRVGLTPYLYFEYMYWVERERCASGSGHCIEEYIIKDKEVNVKQTLSKLLMRVLLRRCTRSLRKAFISNLLEC